MIKYNIFPNSNYSTNPLFKTFKFQKIEKIIWFKKVGDLLNPGDLLCEIHYDDCIFEMECEGGNYLLFKNTSVIVRFSDILSIFGNKNENIKTVYKKYNEDLKALKIINKPLFEKAFHIENSYCEEYENITD